MILAAAAWAATAAILLTYAVSTVRPAAGRHFNLANAIGFLPLAVFNYGRGALPAVIINLGFGIPAVCAVLREISRRRRQRPFRNLNYAEIERRVAEAYRSSGGRLSTMHPSLQRLPIASPEVYEWLTEEPTPEELNAQAVLLYTAGVRRAEERAAKVRDLRSPHNPDYSWKETP